MKYAQVNARLFSSVNLSQICCCDEIVENKILQFVRCGILRPFFVPNNATAVHLSGSQSKALAPANIS